LVSKTGFSGLSDRQERGREEEWTEGRREEAREELKRGEGWKRDWEGWIRDNKKERERKGHRRAGESVQL